MLNIICTGAVTDRQFVNTLILGFCKEGEKFITLLAAAIEEGSVLTEFGISSRKVYDTNITPIILGKNKLEKFWLRLTILAKKN